MIKSAYIVGAGPAPTRAETAPCRTAHTSAWLDELHAIPDPKTRRMVNRALRIIDDGPSYAQWSVAVALLRAIHRRHYRPKAAAPDSAYGEGEIAVPGCERLRLPILIQEPLPISVQLPLPLVA